MTHSVNPSTQPIHLTYPCNPSTQPLNLTLQPIHSTTQSTLATHLPLTIVLRDYSNEVPGPYIASFRKGVSLRAMELELLQDHVQQQPRIVLDMRMTDHEIQHDNNQKMKNDGENEKVKDRRERLIAWSKDSVGRFWLHTMSNRSHYS